MSTPVISEMQPVQERIISATCQYFNISEDQLTQRSCLPDIAYRRKLCAFLLRNNTRLSLNSISSRLGYLSKGTSHLHVEEMKVQVKIYKQVLNDTRNISRLALL